MFFSSSKQYSNATYLDFSLVRQLFDPESIDIKCALDILGCHCRVLGFFLLTKSDLHLKNKSFIFLSLSSSSNRADVIVYCLENVATTYGARQAYFLFIQSFIYVGVGSLLSNLSVK